MEIDNEPSETTKSRSGGGCLKIIGCGLLIVVSLGVIGVYWNHTRMESKLQQTLAEIDRTDPGWRLEEIEAAREEVPEAENSARVIVAAAEQMPKQWPSKDLPQERLRLLPSNELLSAEDYVVLSKELADAGAALAIARKLADMPRGRHPIHHDRNPIATLLPHLHQCRNLANLLVYEAMRQNQRGDSKKAFTACRTALNAAVSIGDEPFYISQLVRISGVILICQSIERTLGQGEPLPEDLEVLQKRLEQEDAFPALVIATRGERAMIHKTFEGVERGELNVNELEGLSRGGLPSQSDRWKDNLISLWRMDAREDHVLFLSLMNQCLEEAQLPLHEQAATEKRLEADLQTVPKNASITRVLMPAVTKMSEAFRRKHAYLRCGIVALAAERYRRDKKAWPDNIDQLCPQFLADVPLDPYDGKPLRYRRVKDGVVIYSVGQDAVDDGGNLDHEHPMTPGVDLGFRLWNVNKRRQPSKPKPEQADQEPMPAPPP